MLHCGTGLQGARHRVSSCTHFRLCINIALKLYKSVKRRIGTPEHVCRQKVLLLNRKQCSSNKESVHMLVSQTSTLAEIVNCSEPVTVQGTNIKKRSLQ